MLSSRWSFRSIWRFIVLVAREERVQGTAHLGQESARLRNLLRAPEVSDLGGSHPRLTHLAEERTDVLVDGIRHLFPRRAQIVTALVNVRAPRVRESDRPTVAGLVRADHAYVHELGERRVDRPRARAPDAVRAFLDLLHDLIAVQRPLAQQHQRRRPHVAATSARPAREPAALNEEGPEPSPAPEGWPV